MYDLAAFRDRIAALYRRSAPYDDGRRPTQQDLADAINLSRSELSSRLNGLRHARLLPRDVHAIIRTLAEWGAITTQAEARELLALVNCPNFTAAEWQSPPLVDLIPPPATPSAAPAPDPASQPRSNLPHAITSFVGRRRELDELARLIPQQRLVTLSGVGGAGKTRLALEVSVQVQGRFADGAYFVELASQRDSDLVAQSVARALGVKEQAGQSASEATLAFIQSKELLLVLDNCEHLVRASATLVRELLTACPRLHVLATSRALLRVAGEVVYPIPPLPLPGEGTASTAEGLISSEAVQLFVERASVHPAFRFSNDNATVVRAICEQLDGIPLAIELAAARLRVLSAAQLQAQLADRFAILADRNESDPRHQTIKATIDWSYNLLTPDEQSLFRKLAVFNGGFTLADVAGILSVPETAVLDELTELLDKSLIYQTPGVEDEPRFAMLETVREYALLKLCEASEEEDARREHANYYAIVAEASYNELRGPQQGRWFARLKQEHDNLQSAATWALDNAPPLALRYAAALFRFWYPMGYINEGIQTIEAALAKSAGPAEQRRAQALRNLGVLYMEQGAFERANSLYWESLQLYHDLDQPREVATCYFDLGIVAMEQGNYERTDEYFTTALRLYREFGDSSDVAQTLVALAEFRTYQDRFVEAEPLAREGLALQRQAANNRAIVETLNILSGVVAHKGDYLAARHFCEEALAIANQQGDRRNAAVSMRSLGEILYHLGDYPASYKILQQSIVLSQELGSRTGIISALELLAEAVSADDPARATRLWGAGNGLRKAIGLTPPPNEQFKSEQDRTALRHRLGNAAYAHAYLEGEMMSLEEAIAYALVQSDTSSSALPVYP
ncbi:MAG: hypothetical protein DLM69_03850 [Candidatus Chloroheliales bacterium]|nr:MAG: hypothetical protein DLM69_03850 [Chloroflexota bacterium]